MDMTLQQLIDLALGKEEARNVDLAIPQPVFDAMTLSARDDIAGWYYAPEVKVFGRLLTKTECWRQIEHRLRTSRLMLRFNLPGHHEQYFGDYATVHVLDTWSCWRKHAERGELLIEEV